MQAMQIELLQQRVARNPYDNDAWELLIEELYEARQQPNGHARLKDALQTCVQQYPAAVCCFAAAVPHPACGAASGC